MSIQFQYKKDIESDLSVKKSILDYFTSISFSHHLLIINKTDSRIERLFYVQKSAEHFWSVRTLKHHLSNQFYKQSELPNNFHKILSDKDREKALMVFKDEYLFDFINVVDADEEIGERTLEQEIVNNIKKFIMAIGNDFSFMGNQYRLIFEEREFYIDLLFYHRGLQCLVAFDLKKGEFKPEYLGKMNFYLSVLDDMIKKEYEAPSIGIVLCKEKNNKIVEYTFRDINKPMGVSVYKTSNKIPQQYKDALPDPESLKRLLE